MKQVGLRARACAFARATNRVRITSQLIKVPGGLFLGAQKSEPWLGRTARARGLTTVKGGSGVFVLSPQPK